MGKREVFVGGAQTAETGDKRVNSVDVAHLPTDTIMPQAAPNSSPTVKPTPRTQDIKRRLRNHRSGEKVPVKTPAKGGEIKRRLRNRINSDTGETLSIREQRESSQEN